MLIINGKILTMEAQNYEYGYVRIKGKIIEIVGDMSSCPQADEDEEILDVKGAGYPDCSETLTVETLYGTETVSYKDALLERCHVCKGKDHVVYDELLGESVDTVDAERFAEVEKLEAMSPEEKFAFFQSELSKCIRCNACRNVCPACSCRKCVFDSTKFDSAQKANTTSF